MESISEKYKLSEETLHQASKAQNLFDQGLFNAPGKNKKKKKPKFRPFYRDNFNTPPVINKMGFINYKKIDVGSEPQNTFLKIEDIIKYFMKILFPGMTIISSYSFRVVRDSDVESATRSWEDRASDLLTTLEFGVFQTRFLTVVKMQVSDNIPDNILSLLKENLKVDDSTVYFSSSEYPSQWLGFHGMDPIFNLNLPHLKYQSFGIYFIINLIICFIFLFLFYFFILFYFLLILFFTFFLVPTSVLAKGEDLFYGKF